MKIFKQLTTNNYQTPNYKLQTNYKIQLTITKFQILITIHYPPTTLSLRLPVLIHQSLSTILRSPKLKQKHSTPLKHRQQKTSIISDFSLHLHFVARRGIEPLLQGWKPCVLTPRRTGLIWKNLLVFRAAKLEVLYESHNIRLIIFKILRNTPEN